MGLVLLSASGLDPVRAFQLQLQKMGRAAVWSELRANVHSALPDGLVVHGRSLRYWRDLWGWPMTEPQLTIKIAETTNELTRKVFIVFFIVSILVSNSGQLVIFEAITQSLFRKLANAGLRNLVNKHHVIRNLPFSNLA